MTASASTFVQDFVQVFKSNIAGYIASRTGTGVVDSTSKVLTNKLTALAGFKSANDTIPICETLLAEAQELKPETMPAFFVKCLSLADTFIKTSFRESSCASVLAESISYGKLRAALSSSDPAIEKYKEATIALIETVKKEAAEESQKKLTYLGNIGSDEKVSDIKIDDIQKNFPEQVKGLLGTYKYYTYLTNAKFAENFPKETPPSFDQRFPLELQTSYLCFRMQKHKPADAIEALEKKAGVTHKADAPSVTVALPTTSQKRRARRKANKHGLFATSSNPHSCKAEESSQALNVRRPSAIAATG